MISRSDGGSNMKIKIITDSKKRVNAFGIISWNVWIKIHCSHCLIVYIRQSNRFIHYQKVAKA